MVKRYEEVWLWKFLRWSGIITIPVVTLIPYKSLIKAIIKSYQVRNYFEVICGGLTMTVGYLILFYVAIALIREFYTVAVKVELGEESIRGYPWYGKKRWEMRYDEIEIIKDRSNIFPLTAITIMGKNKKMYISVAIYPLANVIEYIEQRSIHLQESRLEKLKRSSLWVYGKGEDEQRS